jgi:DNA-binding beta-propeller fold protein YncE
MLSDNDAIELGNAPAGLEIYPNPASSYLNVQINEGERNSTLSIYNTQGSLVKTVPVNSDSEEIDVSELPAGVYILKLHDERVPFIKQFIKE